jgi:hypothetical protein
MKHYRHRGAGGAGGLYPPNNLPYICDFYKLRILKSFRLVNNIFITYIAKYSIYFGWIKQMTGNITLKVVNF